MARPRTPAAKADATGAAGKNPQRYRDRKEPKTTKALGQPPEWFDEAQASIWEGFKRELPWLTESDRSVMELASVLRAAFMASPLDMGVTKLNLLRLCLAQLGATPADRSKVGVGDGEDQDPDDAFFQ
jgi:phage terminase small subunit